MAPQTSLAPKAITTKPSLNDISISLIPLMSKHVVTGSTWQPLSGWQESSIPVKRTILVPASVPVMKLMRCAPARFTAEISSITTLIAGS
jgi:hypothetical protein